MADELATLTYWQLRAFDWDANEHLVEVYDTPEEALHHFRRVMDRDGIRRGHLTYFDGDYCKVIAAFDMYGLDGIET